MNFKFNGGRGAYLCDRCNTMICTGLGPEDPVTAARAVHAPNALVTPDKRLYCTFRCLDKHVKAGHVIAEHAFGRDVIAQIDAMNELEQQFIAANYVPVYLDDIPSWVPTKSIHSRCAVDFKENVIFFIPQMDAKLPDGLQIWTPLWAFLVHDAGVEFFAEGARARSFGFRFEIVLDAIRDDKEARAALLTAYQLGGLRATRQMLFPKYEAA